jgi:hypothetical protein
MSGKNMHWCGVEMVLTIEVQKPPDKSKLLPAKKDL